MPRIVLRLEMTMTVDVLPDDHPNQSGSKPEQSSHLASCPVCGWSRVYKSAASAKRGLAAHTHYCDDSNTDLENLFEQIMPK